MEPPPVVIAFDIFKDNLLDLAFGQPWISNAIYVFVALAWLVPDRRIERMLERQRE